MAGILSAFPETKRGPDQAAFSFTMHSSVFGGSFFFNLCRYLVLTIDRQQDLL
jgi:hypothetical protein